MREDFCWACAYCSITEVEGAGVGFQIDHYIPRDFGGNDEYQNLFYACQPCNSGKSNWLSDDEAKSTGYRIIRIDEEDPRDHYEVDGVELTPRTETGKHNIYIFDLNRKPLVHVRSVRQRIGAADDVIRDGLRRLRELRLDQLPKEHRAVVMKHRERLEAQLSEAIESMEDLIRSTCKSDILDPDPEHEKRARRRRQHLRDVRAILPNQPGGPGARPNKGSPNRKRRGRSSRGRNR